MPRINYIRPKCPECNAKVSIQDIQGRDGEYTATEYHCLGDCRKIWHTVGGSDFAVEGHVPFRK